MDLTSIYKVPTDFYELLELQKILDKRIEIDKRTFQV